MKRRLVDVFGGLLLLIMLVVAVNTRPLAAQHRTQISPYEIAIAVRNLEEKVQRLEKRIRTLERR